MELPGDEGRELQSDHSQMDEEEGEMQCDGEMKNGMNDYEDMEEDGVEFDEGEEEQEEEDFPSAAGLEGDLGGFGDEEEEGSELLMANGDGGHEYDEGGEEEIRDHYPEPAHSSSASNQDWNENDEQGEYSQYSCQVCGLGMIDLKELFTHMEAHDSDEYAFSSDKSKLSEVCFGDSTEAGCGRKWPRRFLKFPSQVFLTLRQFQTVEENENLQTNSYESGSDVEGMVNPYADLRKRTPLLRPAPVFQNGVSGKFPLQRRRYVCPHCQKEFQRSDHFRQHLTNHLQGEDKPFGCKICGERFSVIVTLRRHMSTHPDYKPFECSRCPRRFHDLDLLKIHEESPYTHTETEVNGLANPKVHSRRKCRLCFQTFGNEFTRAEHERRVHGQGQPKPVLRCRYTSCRALQPTLKLLIQHYKEKHGAEKLLEETKKERNGLGRLSNGGGDGEREVHYAQAQLSKTSPPVNKNTQPARGKGTEECRMCFQFLFTIPERNQHELTAHNINHPGTVLQCKYPDCRKILGAKNWLARHIREHRQRINAGMESAPQLGAAGQNSSPAATAQQEGKDEGEEKPSEPQKCLYPDDSSEGESEEIWDCRICNERFGSKSEREGHEEQAHDTENPRIDFNCKFCAREMGNFTSLLFHLDKSHKNQPPNKLPLPPSGVLSASATPTPKSKAKLIFPCRHCDLTYTDQHVRISHEYEVHDTRDALDNFYPCKICGKVMTLRGLRKHLRKIHGHEPQVEVEDIKGNAVPPPSTFSKFPRQQQNLAVGNAAGTQVLKTPNPTSKAVYKRTNEPSTAAWICRLCFQQFDEQRQRETHEHSVHGTNAPNATFICKYSKCELEFGTFRALIKHLREHGETTLPTGQQRLTASSLAQHKAGQRGSSAATPVPGSNSSSAGSVPGSGQAVLQDDKDSLLWKCRLCWEVFPSQQHRLQHEINSHQTNHPSKSLLCKYCPKQFSLMRQLVKHLESHGEAQKQKGQTTTTSGISISRGEEEEEDDGGPPKLELQVPQLSNRKPPPSLFTLK